jgi:hypothetical protein
MRVGDKRPEIRTAEGLIVLQLWIDQLKTLGDSKVLGLSRNIATLRRILTYTFPIIFSFLRDLTLISQ